jgi:hypothetical protein
MKPYVQFYWRWTAAICFLFSSLAMIQGQIHYVNHAAVGLLNGSSWTDAHTDIQSAIDAASAGDSIFVAAGTYLPTHTHLGDSGRHSTFYISKSIQLYGGFSGKPGTEGGFSEHNITTHLTTLSGDLGLPIVDSDNAFHVLYFDHVSDTAKIDGFTIAHGNGLGGVGLEAFGAGIYNNGDGGRSNPTISNCIIRDNRAQEAGGGMTNQAENGGIASPTLINCSFISNLASGGGGLNIYTDTDGEANPEIIGCKFMGNGGPTAGGGGIQLIAHSSICSPKLINCIVTGNHSPTSGALASIVTGTGISNIEIINSAFSGNTGGSMRLVDFGAQTSTVTIRNSIIWGNGGAQSPSTTGYAVDASHSVIPFGFPGEGNIGLDPMYVSQPPLLDTSHILGDLHLLPGSPALDAGLNSSVPGNITTDLDQLPRFVNSNSGGAGTVDIGPYELQVDITAITGLERETEWSVFPNPVHDKVNVHFNSTADYGKLLLLDAAGKIITGLFLNAGQTVYTIDVLSLSQGTYYICVFKNGQQEVQKIIVQ